MGRASLRVKGCRGIENFCSNNAKFSVKKIKYLKKNKTPAHKIKERISTVLGHIPPLRRLSINKAAI